jgi:CPA1 family monovalent cation:H+ antiporter
MTIISAEGLFNDATSLVAYGFALTLVMNGTFSLEAAGLRFLVVIVGSVAIGIAVGLRYEWAARHVNDPARGITLTSILSFAA